MILEDLEHRFWMSVVLEDDSLLLRLPREGYIGANRVFLRMTASECSDQECYEQPGNSIAPAQAFLP